MESVAPSYALLKCPISDISVTGELALRQVQLSLSFKLEEVHTRLLFRSMYFSRYRIA